MCTYTPVWVVWIPLETCQAPASITTRPIVDIYALAIRFACVVVSLLSFCTPLALTPNRPVNNHRHLLCLFQYLETGLGKLELALVGHKRIATWVKIPYTGMIVVARHLDGDVSKSRGDGTLAAAVTGTRLVETFSAVAERYTASGISFFNMVGLNKCDSVAANGEELVFGGGDCEGRPERGSRNLGPSAPLIVAIAGYEVHDTQLTIIKGQVSNLNSTILQKSFWRMESFIA